MNFRKKIISVFLSVLLISSFATIAFHAQAEEKVAYGYSEFVTNEASDDHIGEVVEDLYQAKQTIINGLDTLQRKIEVKGMGLTVDNIQDFYYGLLFDNPQFFYIYTSFSYTYSTTDKSIISILPQYITSNKKPGEDTAAEIAQQNIEIQSMKEAFDKNTAELMEGITDSMSDVEKLLALHDALACHVTYTKVPGGKYDKSIYTAYGSIVEGVGVCQAYTMGYSYLAKLAGVDDIHVVSNEYHSWNMVKLDGEWYHVDVTYDDPVNDIQGRVIHKYFLISDKTLQQNDTGANHATWTPSYSATSTKYEGADNYWSKTDSKVTFDNGKIYYVDMSSKTQMGYCTGVITELSADGSKKELAKVEDFWSAAQGYYVGNYTRLFKSGDYLYYNTPKTVVRVNVNDGTTETIYTLPDDIKETNSIYGLQKGDGKISVGYAKTPNDVMTITDFEYSFDKTPSVDPEPTPEYSFGDVNHDKLVNIKDVTAIQSYLAGSTDEFDISLADIDKNELITIEDCTALQRVIAG